MFQGKHSSKRWKLRFVVVATSALLITGCVGDTPIVSREGEIIAGHPKIRAILLVIRDLRDNNATRQRGVFDASYSAVIYPGLPLVAYEGCLPASTERVAASYSLIYGDRLEHVDTAVVIEALGHRVGKTEIDCVTRVFSWTGDQWSQANPMFRIGTYEEIPKLGIAGSPEMEEDQEKGKNRGRGLWTFERGEWKSQESDPNQ